MQTKLKTSIHNRFTIEVRDKYTNELKQTGVAENIILDRAYTRVCNLQSYFTNILFGNGTGTVSSGRDVLFNKIAWKAATLEETVYNYPISKVTKKIILAPEEYIGEIITEVGISEGATLINTHALITDSEGEPLSITKTSLDVLTIYATVFIQLICEEPLQLIEPASNNVLLKYFLQNITPTWKLSTGKYYGDSFQANVGGLIIEKTITPSYDVANKKIVLATRYGISETNEEVASIALNTVVGMRLPATGVFTSHSLEDVVLGTGDGSKTDFVIPNKRIKDLTVRVDGVATTEFTILSEVVNYDVPNPFSQFTRPNITLEKLYHLTDNVICLVYEGGATLFLVCAKVDEDKIISIATIDTAKGTSWSEKSNITTSADGKYIKITNSQIGWTVYAEFNNSTLTILGANPSGITYSAHPVSNPTGYLISSPFNMVKINTTAKSTVRFTSAPAIGKEITVDYTTPYIPKSTDYVLDVRFDLVFGEGTPT